MTPIPCIDWSRGKPLKLIVEPIVGEKALDDVRAQLLSEGLPVEDLGRSPITFFVAKTETGAAVGWGGLEKYGDAAILRSVVVNSVLRGLGTGKTMVDALIEEARAQGLGTLWLLTQSADGFFAKLGFEPVQRDSAPQSIQASEEFSVLCDDDAICMRLNL
jgi:amino-acid N-acetyltransferase